MMYLNFKKGCLFISILVLLSLFSCVQKETNSANCATCDKVQTGNTFDANKTEKETSIFRKYLKKVLSVDLNNGDIFVIIPDHPCVGCMDEAIAIFKTYKNNGVKLIVTPAHSESLNLHDKNILVDSLGEINKLDMPLENASLLLMGQGSIENMVFTTPDKDKNIKTIIAKHLAVK